MEKEKWVLCPIRKNKTHIKVRPDTVLENFPLFCPKCKRETIISVTAQNLVAVNKSKNEEERECVHILMESKGISDLDLCGFP